MASNVTIDELPFEILRLIMSYLNPSDRRDASLVSRKFLEATDDVSKIIVKFFHCRLDDNSEPVQTFLKSTRKFSRICIQHTELSESLERFGRHFGPLVTDLAIQFTQFTQFEMNKLELLMKHMEVLKSLELYSVASEIFLNNSLSSNVLKTISHIGFTIENLSLNEWESILDSLPNLEVLKCNFVGDGPDWSHYVLDQSVTTHCKTLKELIISGLKLNRNTWQDLSVTQLTAPLMLKTQERNFLNTNKQLTSLGESYPYAKNSSLHFGRFHISSATFPLIPQVLPNLEVLNVAIHKSGNQQHDLDFLCALPNLRFFGLQVGSGGQKFVFSSGYHSFHDHRVNLNMKYFELRYISNPCQLCLNSLTKNFPNLRYLNLSNSELNNANLHAICKNLQHLRILDISGCEGITDSGVIGLVDKIVKPENSLTNLKNLRVLNMHGCTSLTGISATSFKLPELLKLRLTVDFTLYDLSPVGPLMTLAKNCPNLETLVLNCDGINDDSIEVIAMKLRRLKRLTVLPVTERLASLSLAAWEHAEKYCANLQYLCMNYSAYSTRKRTYSNGKTFKIVYKKGDIDDDGNSY